MFHLLPNVALILKAAEAAAMEYLKSGGNWFDALNAFLASLSAAGIVHNLTVSEQK